MLRFFVHRDGAPAERWPLAHAGIVGPDGSTAPGQIRAEHGLLTVLPKGQGPVSLEVVFPIGPSDQPADGQLVAQRRVLLSTTLLPQRPRPYLLSLELARKQVMRFLNALEDWNLAMLPADHPALATFERAREDFSQALVTWRNAAGDDPDDPALVQAEATARRALADACQAGELLVDEAVRRGLLARAQGTLFADAVARAERTLGRSASRPVAVVKAPETHGVALAGVARLGCGVEPRAFQEAGQKALSAVADFISVPMPWSAIEPEEGRYQFAATDRWIEWAVRKGRLPVVAGPVLDLAQGRLPEWLFIWEHDHETLRELVYEHVRQVVTRYRRTVQWWTLASSLGVEGGLSLRFDQIADLLRVASTTARKLHPAGRVQVEIVDPFALYAARTPKTVPPLLLGELITQSGIHVDALGLRVDLTDAQTAGAVRDAMAFSEVLDRYAGLDRPISVTFMLAPSVPPADQDERGQWAGPWSPQAQADWARRMVAIAASKPYVHSICWGLVQDPPGRADGAGLVDASGAPRPALEALVQLRRGLREGALPLGR